MNIESIISCDMSKTRAIATKSGRRKPQLSVVAQHKAFDSDDILLHVLYYCSLKEMGNFVVAFPKKKAVLSNIEIDYEVMIDSVEFIGFLASNKIRLTSFTLDYDHKLTDYHLLALACLSPNLRTIDGASGVSTTGIRWLIERCPRIEEWFLQLRIPEVFLEIVSNAYPDLRGVRIGPFNEGDDYDQYQNVDRSVIVNFVNRCQQLENLELWETEIDDADFEGVCNLRQLKYLRILSCDRLTPNCLQFLLRCNHLETLEIIHSVVHPEIYEDDELTVFSHTIYELLRTLKSLRYVQILVDNDEVENIVFPPTWRRVVSNSGFHHEFFRL